VARHCNFVSLNVCPKTKAIKTPINPEIKNLIDKAANGEEYNTIIRAEVNADDQMSTKIKPNKIARTFMFCFSALLRNIIIV
jgi:hypothetical protein